VLVEGDKMSLRNGQEAGEDSVKDDLDMGMDDGREAVDVGNRDKD
jgi:hypothetical protein